jgi:hypothetical protein
MSLTKILYIGANDHIQPVRDFSEVKEFIFIDSQPVIKDGTYDFHDKFMYRLLFMLDIYGFKKVEERILDNSSELEEYFNPTLLIFQNESTGQILKYYVSCKFPFEFVNKDEIIRDIEECDGLLISGFCPHPQIFDYLKSMTIFIGYSSTYFGESDRNTILNVLHYMENDEIEKYFKYFYFVKNLFDDNNTHLHWAYYKNKHDLLKTGLINFIEENTESDIYIFCLFSEFYNFYENFPEYEYEEECRRIDDAADEDMSDVLVL